MTPLELSQAALERARRALVDVDETFTLLLAALVVGGHVLLEGVPGTGKTLIARTLATLFAADAGQAALTPGTGFRRIQFTPDLMPSDIVGTTVYQSGTGTFSFHAGPIFASVVLADEINRAPAKTQAALLEAMEEQQVTVEGERRRLPDLFLVVATQNPVEFEGTYPLPEAQLDRFLFKITLGYGSQDAERAVVARHHEGFRATNLAAEGIAPMTDLAGILDVRRAVDAVRVDESVLAYLVELNRATRADPDVQFGASVRGALGLLLGSKALAAFSGRDYVTPDDVKAVAPHVLRHRVILKPEAELDGSTPDGVVARLLASVPVPR